MANVKSVGGTFLDTTVLLAGLVDFGAQSRASLAIMDAVAAGRIRQPITAWHCCLEFFSVATRLPEALRLDPDDARRLLMDQVLPRFDIRDLPVATRERLFATAVVEGYSGGRIYDLHIGEVARCAQARIIVTDNRRHFSAMLSHEIRVLSSAAFAAEESMG